MTTLSSAEAFAAYEAARKRLPNPAEGKGPPRMIDTLKEVTCDFDVFLLDAFGVLNIGDSPIAGTPERVRDLQAAGKRVLVVSNAASVSRDELLHKYARLGYAFAPDDVITSRMAAAAGCTEKPDMRWGVMGLSGKSMDDFGTLNWHLLEDDPEAYSRADGFLLIGSGEWTAVRQTMMKEELERRPRPVKVANPDIVAPRENGFSVEPGCFAHELAETTGLSPVFYGKPFKNIYDLVFERLGGAQSTRIAMVGDSLHTDILGAHVAGISSILISDFGFFAGQDFEGAIAQSRIVPDYVARRP